MLLGTVVYFWISWHMALLVRAGQVAVDTCQEWQRVCAEQKRAKRREEERDGLPTETD